MTRLESAAPNDSTWTRFDDFCHKWLARGKSATTCTE
jgi:hypothetical protein